MKSSKVDSGKRIEERKKMKKKINPLPLTTHHSLLAIWKRWKVSWFWRQGPLAKYIDLAIPSRADKIK